MTDESKTPASATAHGPRWDAARRRDWESGNSPRQSVGRKASAAGPADSFSFLFPAPCLCQRDADAHETILRAMPLFLEVASMVERTHRESCPGETCGTAGIDLLKMQIDRMTEIIGHSTISGHKALDGGEKA